MICNHSGVFFALEEKLHFEVNIAYAIVGATIGRPAVYHSVFALLPAKS